jgi:NAD(P) transhydrogenase beta subunit
MIGRRTTATDLPQTVAALHSVVGLAAVLTSFGSVMAHIGGADISTLHMVAGYLGVLIGKALFRPSRSFAYSFRWCNIHRLGCGFPQACGPHVIKANQNPWPTTLPQLISSWS